MSAVYLIYLCRAKSKQNDIIFTWRRLVLYREIIIESSLKNVKFTFTLHKPLGFRLHLRTLKGIKNENFGPVSPRLECRFFSQNLLGATDDRLFLYGWGDGSDRGLSSSSALAKSDLVLLDSFFMMKHSIDHLKHSKNPTTESGKSIFMKIFLFRLEVNTSVTLHSVRWAPTQPINQSRWIEVCSLLIPKCKDYVVVKKYQPENLLNQQSILIRKTVF